MVSCGSRKVIGILFHYVVVFRDQGFISVEPVIHERQENGCTSPFGRIAESSFKNNIFGSYIGNQTIWKLCIAYILHDLRCKCGQVKIVKQSGTVQMYLFEPSEFFTVGTIGKHGMHITFDRIHNNPVCLIEYLI